MRKPQERVKFEGRRFGWWTAIRFLYQCPKTHRQIYLCRDVFGAEKEFSTKALYHKNAGNKFKTKDSIDKYTLLRAIHTQIHRRCSNPKCPEYKNYGYRGIYVHPEWSGDYGFYTYMFWAIAKGWKKGLTIDRINVDGPYSSENCRLVTKSENARYKRSTKLSFDIADKIRADFKTKTGDIMGYYKTKAKMYEVNPGTIAAVIKNRTWVQP